MNRRNLRSRRSHQNATQVFLSLFLLISLEGAGQAATLFKFDFNEGTGTTITDTNGTLTGSFGFAADPANQPVPSDDTPSGAANDKALTIVDASGFLIMDATGVTNFFDLTQPLTTEAWIKIPETAAARAEGIVGFGGSWKFGLRPDGRVAFTLFGVVDATVDIFPPLGSWVHLAAVWQPGVGITYYVGGVETATFPETRPMRAPQNNVLGIGSGGTGEPINATIDRVRVHQAALAAEDLDTNATAPKSILASTLVAFDFNETSPPYTSKGLVQRPTIFAQDYQITAASPVWTNDVPSRRTNDTALSFDGNDRVRVIDETPIVTLETGDFTVQAWVKFGTLPGARSVLFFNNGPGGAISFSVTSDRRVFVTTLGIADTPSAAIVPNDSLWHHIAVIHRNGTDLRFYVDGVLGDTIPYTAGVIKTRTDTFFTVGSEGTGGLAYRGLLDRLQLSDEAVDPTTLDYLAVPGVIPGIPELEIGVAVSIAWPADVTGFLLQSTTNLNEPKVWSNVSGTPVVVGDKFYTLLPTPEAKTFYRLTRPQ
jgi:hypothetical protein